MKKLIFLTGMVLFIICGVKIYAQNSYDYCYYVPHVVTGPEFYPYCHGYTVLYVVFTEDDTDIEVDLDGDGIYEDSYHDFNAGEETYFSRSNWPSPNGTLSTGASIRTNNPLQIVIHFHHNDFGTYDAGFMFASLIPKYMWGGNFVVPASATYAYVFADVQTEVTIQKPGESSFTQTLMPRTNLKLSNVPSGTTINADNSIYVLGVNCQSDQNYPWMYNVLPISQLGSDYYFDATYGEYDISWPWPTNPELWITAVNEDTKVYIDENKDGTPENIHSLTAGQTAIYSDPVQGAHIWANNEIYMVLVENWAQAFNGKYGGAATEYLSTDNYGTEFALYDYASRRILTENNPRIFILAAEDSTQVDIDFDWDGLDLTNSLNKGQVWTVLWPEELGATAQIKSQKDIQVIYKTDVSHWDHPGVNLAYTAIPLVKIIEANINIDPDTLNLKSKGKWITAYVELPGEYDVNAIDIAMVSLHYNDISIPVDWGEVQDGILMLKFSMASIIDLFDGPGNYELRITGDLNGTKFEGEDTIRVILGE